MNTANQELSVLVIELQKREHEMLLINQMNDFLQTCKTKEEAYQVISLAIGELFPGQSGGLAILHNSGNFLETFATWGNEPILAPAFSLDDCWGMRRGQSHEVTDPQANIICSHFIHAPKNGYLCLPLVVQGETLGLFYLGTPIGLDPEHAIRWRQLADTASEGIKYSLSNLQLREIMQEQATHDPLTGLFNRRYLDVTLPRELSHTRRKNETACIAMLDIDKFKHFNDIYGHDAGDLVLRELARVLGENIRQSDIACRFGGEEFLLVLFDSTLAASQKHLEKIFALIKEMQIRYEGKLLGTITVSAGIVETSEQDFSAEELLKAADQAMYAAKRAGRNCIIAFQYPGKNLSEAGS